MNARRACRCVADGFFIASVSLDATAGRIASLSSRYGRRQGHPDRRPSVRAGDRQFWFYHGLNDNGGIAFLYRFADGTFGIAVAAIPEPAMLPLTGLMA